jgi:hypothetical protein
LLLSRLRGRQPSSTQLLFELLDSFRVLRKKYFASHFNTFFILASEEKSRRERAMLYAKLAAQEAAKLDASSVFIARLLDRCD